MATNSKLISVPATYVTAADAEIKVTNYPETSSTVTPVQIVTLNRPAKLNAITPGMISGLTKFFETVDVDSRVKVVILTGCGKAFSAGIDLNNDASKWKDLPASQLRDPGGWLALAMYNCSKIVIVAYNGLSVGIGMTSTLASAIRIAPANAEFGFPFARIGLTMESCASFFLPRMVGYAKATYLLVSGKRFPADSNVLQGIFAEIVPTPEDVMPKALEVAKDILDNVSPMAAHLNRQLIWRGGTSAEMAHLIDSPILADQFGSSDHLEFKKAFFGKRNPTFTDTLENNAPRTYPWWTEVAIQGLPRAQRESPLKL